MFWLKKGYLSFRNQTIMRFLLPFFLFGVFIFLHTSLYSQCSCDLILHNRSSGDGLQNLDFADMPDSTSSLYTHNDSLGWIELVSTYSSIVNQGVVKPGVAICLGQITRRVYLENVVGDSLNPIIIKNRPGQIAEIKAEPTYAGLQLHNSRYFEVKGDCSLPESVHGIFIHGINSNGVEVSGLSQEFTISRVRVDTAGTGVKVKDNRDVYFANCQLASGVDVPDDSTWFASNITIEHCELSNLKNEGVYMNNTSYKYDFQCDNNRLYYGYEMDGVYIHKNRIINTGKDGIQTTGVVRNCIIESNEILNIGTDGYSAHGSGIHFGEGCAGRVANNWVEKTMGSGVFAAGLGLIEIYQNVILQTGGDAIKAHAGTKMCTGDCNYAELAAYFGLQNYSDLEQLRIFNNTIAFTAGIGININAPVDSVSMNHVYVNNNIITEWTVASMDFISSPTANYDGFTHAGNNLIVQDISDVHFQNGTVNTAGNYGINGLTDVRLAEQSAACDGGVSLFWMNESLDSLDFSGLIRVQSARIDCGAYESPHAYPAGLDYISTAEFDCALPPQVYGFDGEGLGAGYRIALLDTLKTGRIWFQNLEGNSIDPIEIVAVSELAIEMSYSSNAIAFKNSSNFELGGDHTVHISADNPSYANIDFITDNSGNVVLSNLSIVGSDDLVDVAHGYGTNLLDTLLLDRIHLESQVAGKNLIRVKGAPSLVVLKNVSAVSSVLNQTLMEVNLQAGGDLGIYNSIFDGFDTDASKHKWIQLSMQPVTSSYLANSVSMINNTFVNLANSHVGSTSNFRLLHKIGTGYIDSLILVNNAINKSAIESELTNVNYNNSSNEILTIPTNYVLVSNNYASPVYDSLGLQTDYIPNADSPLINEALDFATSPVRWRDFYENTRPDSVSDIGDIGACELGLDASYAYAGHEGNQKSMEKEPEQIAIEVYPNPVNDLLRINLSDEKVQVSIINEFGEYTYQKSAVATNGLLEVPTNQWADGVYHLKVMSESSFQYAHVIVKH